MSSPEYMDSPECDRNPSPPPELADHPELLEAENIGNTVFSKHWLFTTLIKLIEEVNRENEEETDLAVDVDEDMQNELCKLWDMSMNADVAKFLMEFKAVDILSGIIQKSKAPRVIEIAVGILGNMACEQTVCKQMSENHKFIELVILLMETRDVPTLVENTRLIFTSLSNTGTRGPWIRAIQRSEEVLGHLKFIFSSSTNCDLLKNTAELVDTLLDLEPDLCVSWATNDFIQSLLEATEQIGSNHSEALEVYLHIFQSFSTTESGVEGLVVHIDRLEKKIIKYLNIVCEYEIVGLDGKEGPLASALSVLNILIASRPVEKLGHLCKDESIIRVLLKILEPLFPMIQKYREAESNSNKPVSGVKTGNVISGDQSDSEKESDSCDNANNTKEVAERCDNDPEGAGLNEKEETEYKQFEVLYEILSAFIVDYSAIAFQNSPVDRNSGDAGNSPSCDSSSDNSNDNDNSSHTTGKKSQEVPKGDDSDQVNVEESSAESLQSEKFDHAKNKENGSKTKSEDGCTVDRVPILTYLDEACSRWRINNFGLCLKESVRGSRHYDRLFDLAEKYKKERLCRVLSDISSGKIVTRANSSKESEEKT